jgi:hypothetical protein
MASAEYMQGWRAKKGKEYKISQQEYDKKRYQKKKEEIKARVIKRYYNNWEQCQVTRNAWNAAHKNEIVIYQAQYYQENKEELIPAMNKRYYENSERYNKAAAKKKKIKYHSDDNFRIKEAYSSRIRGALKKGTKDAQTIELLGCTIPELREHIEKQFFPGMTWKNYGEWVIDHKIPCCSFDLMNPEHQRLCFHYVNLRPYWASDNLIKEKMLDLVTNNSPQSLNTSSSQ